MAAVMKNVFIPLTSVPSLLFRDDNAVSAGGDGIGEVLATGIHRYDRREWAGAIESCKGVFAGYLILPTYWAADAARAPAVL